MSVARPRENNSVIFKRTLRRSVYLPILIGAAIAAIFLWQIESLRRSLQQVDHSDRAIAGATYVQKLFIDAETGVRGYVLNRRDEFLQPYEASARIRLSEIHGLENFMSGSPEQMERLRLIDEIGQEWSMLAESAIAKARRRPAAGETADFASRELMDKIRAEISNFIAQEEKLRAERFAASEASSRRAVVSGLLLGVLLAMIIIFWTRRLLRGLAKRYDDTLTELEKNREHLEKSLNSRDDFMSVASHELKTPLTTLKLQLQLGQRSFSQNAKDICADKINQLIENCYTQTQRIDSLVDSLLDVTRIKSGRLPLEFSQTDLCVVIAKTIDQLRPQLEDLKCPVDFTASGPILARIDEFRMVQVITNLLSNSMKYGPGRPIAVKAQCCEGKAIIAVSDCGIGIPKEKQDVIFERFERANNSNRVTGLGLGLYIVRQIVEAHNGTVAVQSEVNKGATFTVTIPVNNQRSQVVN